MFRDEICVRMKAGDGGNGSAAFLREAHMPKGGPAGGDGGRGGDVVIIADENYNTLYHLIHTPRFVAASGLHGGNKNCSGKSGHDLEIRVPVGTLVKDDEHRVLLKDLDRNGVRVIVCKGGRGGRGNQHFATSTNQAPRKAEPGQPGQERRIRLELKMIADVGLVGLPNAGKSTLLGRLSAARPRVAAYPFTTLIPHLGVIRGPDYRDVVLADLPGIIEGAHEGKGLGDQFLKHVERTRLIVHLVDCSPEALHPPARAYATIRKELESHSPVLAAKPEIVVATKLDATGAVRRAAALAKVIPQETLFRVSAATGKGIPELVRELFRSLFAPDGIK
jgi:GTP-binding protein